MTSLYQLTANPNIVTRTSDGASIPLGVNQTDSNAYDLWLSEGNTPDPYVAPAISLSPSVQAALDESDKTMSRIQEGISLGLTTALSTDVVAWVNYRRSLRSLLKSTTVGVLPTKPSYPVGT